MVAKTPLKEKRLAMALDPNLVREAVKKVDRCMARLQELQYTVTGGTKVTSGVSLSPRSTRGYIRTSVRCKQESLRLKNAAVRKSPVGKFPGSLNGGGEWQRMSLPARLLGETVGEILQVSQFAKEITSKASTKILNPKNTIDVPKTPDVTRRNMKRRPHCENNELRARRTKEKQSLNRSSESSSPSLTRVRSSITFRPKSPLRRSDNKFINRVSPKNRPWVKKTVLFPNPLYSSSSSSPKKFFKTRSPIIARTTQLQKTPHKFLIKSPAKSLKSQMKTKKAVLPGPLVLSPVEKKMVSTKMRRRSFSPSKLASRLVSPLRSRTNALMSGLKQRPNFSTPLKKMSSIKSIQEKGKNCLYN